MAYAHVGTSGVRANGATSAAPAFGTGQSRTANNLLICYAIAQAASGNSTITAGWSTAVNLLAAGTFDLTVFYKVAAGSDAAPTVSNATGNSVYASLDEFSGGATASPVDQSGTHTSATSPSVATGGGVDAAAGELVIYVAGLLFSGTSAGNLGNQSLNNGATANNAVNTTLSTTAVWGGWGWGITTGNGAADTATCTGTPGGGKSVTTDDIAFASFKLVAVGPANPTNPVVAGQAVPRAATRMQTVERRNWWRPRLWVPPRPVFGGVYL